MVSRQSPARLLLPLLACLLFVGGCNRLRSKPSTEYVYVVAKETFLRDRVAAVSNRVANITNGQRLLVLEHGRRFLKVKTDKGEIGWIEEHGVIDQDTYQAFADLSKQHANDSVVATAVLRDDLYLHVKPGRQTDRFYLLPEGDKLQMLVRASVPKATPAQAVPLPTQKKKTQKPAQPPAASGAKAATAGAANKPAASDSTATAPPPEQVPLEDWWLVRDSQGKVGWMLSRRLDVDVPDAIAGYSEGQRIVGAYELTKVSDPESNFPNGQVPEFVTVTSPYKDGLPYDFDRFRVFIWNVKKHRYETSYRMKDLQGYLPVKVTTQAFDKIGTVPVFTIKTATDDAIAIDPATGASHPANITTQSYRLEGVIVHKVEAPTAAPPVPAAAPVPQAPAATASRRAARRARRVAAHPAHAKHHKHK